MSVFIQFIAQQLIESPFELSIKENVILIKKEGALYTEPFFDTKAEFHKNDLDYLIEITNLIEKASDLKELPSDINLLKNWYLLTHEKYFKEDLTLDRYDRIGQENLKEEFFTILRIPIADVLKRILQDRLNIKKVGSPKLYLTCDFDDLNIWDVWKIKDFAREVFLCSKKMQFKKLYETIGSYFFSRKLKIFNGYLNLKMYEFEASFINIGFFISSTTNQKYDGRINYKNRLVKNFIDELKSKNVIFGLHANYDTKDNPSSIFGQKNDFQELFQSNALVNRHHYLRFRFPDFLKTLEDGEITKDFSLYFPESTLFRAGTCSSYYAWNESEDRAFSTELIPTTLMDGTFSDYLHCNYEDALHYAKEKIDLTLQYCDSLVLLWHNRSTYRYSNIENNYHPELISELIQYVKDKT